jgi:hypothetical protein
MQTHAWEEEDLSEEIARRAEELQATLLAKVGEREKWVSEEAILTICLARLLEG